MAPWPGRRRGVGTGRRFCWWWGSLVGSSRDSSITRRGRSAALRFVRLERFEGSVLGRLGRPAVEACRPNGVPAVLGRGVPLERSCRAGLGLLSVQPSPANLSARLTRCPGSVGGRGRAHLIRHFSNGMIEDGPSVDGAQPGCGVRLERVDVAPRSRIDRRMALPWGESSGSGRAEVAPPQDLESSQ